MVSAPRQWVLLVSAGFSSELGQEQTSPQHPNPAELQELDGAGGPVQHPSLAAGMRGWAALENRILANTSQNRTCFPKTRSWKKQGKQILDYCSNSSVTCCEILEV